MSMKACQPLNYNGVRALTGGKQYGRPLGKAATACVLMG